MSAANNLQAEGNSRDGGVCSIESALQLLDVIATAGEIVAKLPLDSSPVTSHSASSSPSSASTEVLPILAAAAQLLKILDDDPSETKLYELQAERRNSEDEGDSKESARRLLDVLVGAGELATAPPLESSPVTSHSASSSPSSASTEVLPILAAAAQLLKILDDDPSETKLYELQAERRNSEDEGDSKESARRLLDVLVGAGELATAPPLESKAGKSRPKSLDRSENDEVKEFDFNDQRIRKPFVGKVFFCLMCQLLITLGFITVCIFCNGIRDWFKNTQCMLWVAPSTIVGTALVIPRVGNMRRQAPMNFICLGIFTLAESLCLGFFNCTMAPQAVTMAVGVTAAVCLALTLFALQSKWDYTMTRGFLVCITVVLLLLGIVVLFAQQHSIHLAYGSVGVLIFSMYLVYDIHVMMGGEHKFSTSPEEYIFAALNLYLDFFNIFLLILSTIATIRGRNLGGIPI